ncbi:oligosaccharide flippase family protein [Adhaeribacter rhizoryzae]|uniref:Oligosaccharide flippase family protein n=1 Tax=Adhaeribacter rhizoryzae TaxID=2607907 RepID=A0A5M6DRA2_9BACT|nr:oligosaccharide flippase family protein [Adhaeribacter rhizoryzae]KAA5548782.1 oligosaccharide flippase family protein [Adhaeribacter rhizoryzae]
MSRVKSAFWGSVSSQLFMVISMLLGMVTTPFILKFLDKEEYGLSTILFQIVGYLSMFDFGLGSAVARYLATSRGEDEATQTSVNRIISTSFFTYSILGILVIVAGISLSPFLPQFFEMNARLSDVAVSIAFTLSIFIGLQFPLKVFSSIFYAHQRQLLSNTTGFIIGLLNLILPVIFLYFEQGLWSFVYTNIISTVISIVVTFYLLRKYYGYLRIRPKYFDKELLGQMFSFGFFLFLNAIAVQIIFFTDRFFIGSFVSLTTVTIYYLTAKIPEICMNLVFKITDNAYPAMVEIVSKEGGDKFKQVHQKLLLITVCCIISAFWLVLILDHWFIKLWVGESNFAGYTVLVLTLVLMVTHSIQHVSAVCLNGAGLVKGFSVVSIIEAGVNLGLTIFLGKQFGIIGILVATIIAGFCTSMWFIPYTAIKFMRINLLEYLFKPILLPMAGISLLGVAAYFVSNNIMQGVEVTWLNFTLLAFMLSVAFGIFVWLVFLKNEFSGYIPVRFKKLLFV